MSDRLPPGPNQRIDRGRPVTFEFDGKGVEAYEGDTIGSALHASGRRTISRSFKYHRPRGLLCCAGQCPNCLVEVDGWPGVRACTEPVRQGMDVRHMNASPSLQFDAMRATDLVGSRLTPPGFYYKTFIRPRRLWPLYERVLRHAAGLGKLPKKQAGAGVAHRVPPPPRRRSGDRRRHRGHGGRAASRRAGRRCRPRRRRPRARWISSRRRHGRRGQGARREGCGGRGRDPRAGGRDRLVRRARAGLVRQHAASDPGRCPHHRDRLDRAAPDVRGQRPPRGDALLRRRAARVALRRPARETRGDRDHHRSRARVRARPARRGGRRRGGRRRPPRGGRRGARGAAGAGGHPAAARHRRGQGLRPQEGEGSGGRHPGQRRPAGRRDRSRHRLRPGGGLRRERPVGLAAPPGRRQGALGRGRRRIRAG